MTEKVKQMAPIIWEEIKKANNILLHCHPSSDGDSVGSALGLMHVLKNVGKKVTVISGDDPTPQYLGSLPGIKEIVQKNYLETDVKSFDLFLILDSSNKNQISKKGDVVFPESMRTVVIDHHTNFGYGNIDLIDDSYPAVAQMIYELVKLWDLEITKEAAACLFAGIYGDTGGFKYAPTTYETLLAGSELAKIYPEFPKMIFEMENSVSPDQIKFLGVVLGSVEHYFNDKVALGVATMEQIKKNKINPKSVIKGDVANMLKSVTGWDIGICCVEAGENHTEFNFRGRDGEKYDLGEIARRLGGGGHRAAAGAPVKKSLAEAKELLLKTIQEVYPELGQP